MSLMTAGDLASYIKNNRGRAPERTHRPYTTPGNTAAIPLTIKALQRKAPLPVANTSPNAEEFYLPRPGPVAAGIDSAPSTPAGYGSRPQFARSQTSGPKAAKKGGAKLGVPDDAVRRCSSARSVRNAAKAGTQARPTGPKRNSLGPSSRPVVVSKHTDPTHRAAPSAAPNTARRGLGTGIMSSAVAKATMGYR